MAVSPTSFDNWTVTEWDEIRGYKDGLMIFTLDELQDVEIQNTEETQEITGANGVVLNTTKKNKGCKGTGTNGLLSGGLMSLQTGSEQTRSNIVVRRKDEITVTAEMATAKAITISKTPTGTAGAEIGYAYVTDSSTGVATTYSQGVTAGEGVFSYATKTLTFAEDVLKEGDTVVVDYKVALADGKGVMISNDATKYSGECELVYSGTAKNACGKTACFEFSVPRADFTGNFNFTKGDSQMTHSFEWTALKNKCSTAKVFWNFVIFSDED